MRPEPLPVSVAAALAAVLVSGLGLGVLAGFDAGPSGAWILIGLLLAAFLAGLRQLWRQLRHQARQIERGRIQVRNLHDAQQRWQFALESARDGLWDWNLKDDTLILSRQWTAMLGYGEKDVRGESSEWLRLMHPDDRAATQAVLQAHLDGTQPHYAAEFRLATRDGGWRWIQARGQVIERDARGQPLRMIGTHTDIHAQKTAELALRQHEAELAAIFELSPDGIVSVSADGTVHAVNPAFSRLTGLLPADVVGQDAATLDAMLAARSQDPGLGLNCQPSPGSVAEDAGAVTNGCSPCRIALRLPRHCVLLRTSSPLADHPLEAVQHYRDITSYVDLDEAKTEFLKAASIHLRGPLASVYGFSELLLGEEYDPDTRRDLLDTIYKNTRQLVNLVNDLLDLNHVKLDDAVETVPEAVDIMQVVDDAVSGFRRLRDRWPMQLDRPPAPILVLGDAGALRRALRNVLDNAVRFSPDGGQIRVSVERCLDAEGRTWAALQVRDRGIGLSEAQRARVFEPFYKAEGGPESPGSGLGLPIVKQIVEEHQGHVLLDSKPGQGTTVSLWLPVAGSIKGATAAHPALTTIF